MCAAQSIAKLLCHRRKIALNPARSADQHMVMVRQRPSGPLLRQGMAQKLAKAPLHPVAHHGIADFLGDGDPIAYASAPIGPGQQHKSGLGIAQPLIGRDEI